VRFAAVRQQRDAQGVAGGMVDHAAAHLITLARQECALGQSMLTI
jgi:hypothetical protein